MHSPESPSIDSLEPRLLLASASFAVIGDYGSGSDDASDVAELVRDRDPDFIVTVGDNNYPDGGADTIDNNIGRFYHDYIYPYKGRFGDGAPKKKNRFFPVLGNHDYNSGSPRAYLDYFTLPGNERYYSFKRGPVQFFMIDSDPRARDLGYVDDDTSTAESTQGRWLRKALARSDARYKLVVMHHPPYSSGERHGSSRFIKWPFREWGATAILSGHEHSYERIDRDGTVFIVNGLGGRSFRGFSDEPVSGSRVRFTGDYGALFVSASDKRIAFKFITRAGKVIDRHVITAVPAAPSRLKTAAVKGGIRLTWRDSSANESFFKVQRSAGGDGFKTLERVDANVTTFIDAKADPDDRYTYRVRATNDSGSSEWVIVKA